MQNKTKKIIEKQIAEKTQKVSIKKNKILKSEFLTSNKINKLVSLILIFGFFVLPLKPLLADDGDLTITQDTVLTEDINGAVIIGADNITLDCNGYKITGFGDSDNDGYNDGYGIYLHSKNNVTVKNCTIENFYIGIFSEYSPLNTFIKNNISNNNVGISLGCSNGNEILENNISNNELGFGISNICPASDNLVYHNNFKNNTSQAFVDYPHNDLFDNGYPEGGNYWSDYTGQDLKKGESQKENGSDGIGDTAYPIPNELKLELEDRYPFMQENGWKEEVPEWRKNIQPGDILYDAGALKGIGHVGMYVGDVEIRGEILHNQTIEADKKFEGGESGVQYRSIEEWDYPKKQLVYLLRVFTSKEIKEKAIAFAKDQREKPYDTFWIQKNPDSDSPSWYCSELVWAAYYNQGVDIEYTPDNSVVRPDEIYKSMKILTVAEHLNYIVYQPKNYMGPLILQIRSPVNVEITDPDGNVISKEIDGIDDAVYIIDDLDDDGDYEDTIGIATRKIGQYVIKITPKVGALYDDTYTLKVFAGDAEIILADNLKIGDIPTGGQIFILNSNPNDINGEPVSDPINENFSNPAHGGFYDTETSSDNSYSAGTLDFSLNADEWQPEEKAINLLPGDSITRNVNVVNDGTLDFQYKVKLEKTAGDDDFCNALKLKAELEGRIPYEGSLMDFVANDILYSPDTDNWNFEVSLPIPSSEFEDKSCEFKFVFSGWQDNLTENEGFFDVEELENIIEAGSSETGGFSPIADSYIDQTQRDINYGDKSELYVRSKIDSGANKRTFIAFGFHFPESTIIFSSLLKLYMKSAPPVSRDYETRMVLSNWKEKDPDGINWNNQSPAADIITDTISTGDATPKWLLWNVTSDVQNFVSGIYPNYGWRINDRVEESPTSRQGKFYSRENSNIPLRPVLEINFSAPAATTTYPVINEVYYHVGSGKGSDPKNEWVEIYNPTDSAVDISGWKICDNNSCDDIPFSSPIPAKGFAVIAANSSTWDKWPSIPASAIKINLNSYFGNGLNNSGDSLILKNNTDTIIDAMSYGSDISQFDPSIPLSGKGKSLTRIIKGYDTDSAVDWIINAAPNPGINPSKDGAEVIRFGSEGIEMATSEENLTPLSSGEGFLEEPEEDIEIPEKPQGSIIFQNSNNQEIISPEITLLEEVVIEENATESTNLEKETTEEIIIEDTVTEEEVSATEEIIPTDNADIQNNNEQLSEKPLPTEDQSQDLILEQPATIEEQPVVVPDNNLNNTAGDGNGDNGNNDGAGNTETATTDSAQTPASE